MAIQIERNENGNCINFKGATQPVYWNNCLTAVAVGTDRINIENDIRSAGAGQTYYEYFNVKVEDFCDNTGTVFTTASSAVSYINGVAKATPSGGIGPNDNINTTGIITAAQFSGDGSGLTGITATGSGVVIQEEGSNVGTAATLNFVGAAVTATISGGVATIGITGGVGIGSTRADGEKLNWGDNDELQIWHHGNGTGIIQNAGSGQLQLRSNEIRLLNAATDEDYAFFRDDGAVELYYDNTKRFETTPDGVSITGVVSATSFSGDGSALTGITTSQIIGYSAGGGGGSYANSDVDTHLNVSGASSGQILSWNGSDYAWVADQTGGGGGGSGIGTQLADNVTLNFGDSNDLQIFHNGTSSFIKDVGTGSLIIQGSNIRLQNYQASGTALQVFDGSAQLYNNNSKKLETTPDGVSITGVATVSSKVHVGGGTTFTEDLVVTGDARVTGILSIGTGTIVLDPNNDEILVGDVKLKRSASGTIEIRSKNNALKDIRARRIISNGMSEDDDGNLSITGVVTATTFVKSSGTSSQFLKADGSVDSTSYSTFDGNYNNLTNRPTIPTNNNQLTNGAGYITTSFTNTNQLVNGAGFITTSFTSYNQLSDTPTIPTNNNQLTNGAGYTTFDGDYNNLTNKPTIPTNNSQLTNGAGFITNNVSGDLTLTDTATDNSAGPEFVLYRNSSSPASSDYIGQIKFQGESDSGATRLYAKITGKIGDPTNGSEDGIIEIAHRKNGSNNISGRWNQDNLLLINGTGLSVNGQITAESNLDVTGNIIVSGNVDGRDVSVDGTKLDGIETSADVTDATNVAAAGAVMESDTTTANMSFVVDEDNMASDSNTKVPTQQSVKAYVDANSGGGGTSTGKAIALSFIFG